MKAILIALLLLVSTGCSKYMTALKDGSYENNIALREMNYEMEELKVALQQARIEISALEDRLQSQERELLETFSSKHGSSQMALIERRLDELKSAQLTTLSELQSLQSHANKTSTSLTAYRDKINSIEQRVSSQDQRLSDVAKLKTTLTSISQAMKAPSPSASHYHVVAGDTLAKIASRHGTTVQKLKDVNNLTSNRILIGQKLIIPE